MIKIVTKYKKTIRIFAILILISIPIFRWNFGNKIYYSILDSLFNKDINTIELLLGNIYNTALDLFI